MSYIWHARKARIDLSHPRIMGVLNITPDSFSGDGLLGDHEVAVAHARQMELDGADIINDVSGLTNPAMIRVVSQYNAGVVIMHGRVERQGFDIVDEVISFFATRIRAAKRAGIKQEAIVLDPGLGFDKSYGESLALLQAIPRLRDEFDYPLLIGASLKGFIGKIIGREGVDERHTASVNIALLAANDGAHIVRVHDVMWTTDALMSLKAIRS